MTPRSSSSRRSFLTAGAVGLGAAFLGSRSWSATLAPADETLKDIARRKNIAFGAMAQYEQLRNDPWFAAVFPRECAVLVNGWDFSLSVTQPSADSHDFHRPDFLATFAAEHGMALRGHALVFHDDVPPWVRAASGRQEAERILLRRVETMVARYRGRVAAWDVVNEVIDPSTTPFDELRRSPWLELIGPEYIDIAFAAAAAADPCAVLVFNEYGLYHAGLRSRLKRWKTLKRLEALKKAGVPVHALGIQGHVFGALEIDDEAFREFLKEVAGLGLEIMITELDVLDSDIEHDFASRDRKVADAYARFLAPVVEETAVIAITTWGLSDRYTWHNSSHPYAEKHRRKDGADHRPLPLDVELGRKPAWYALALAFANAAPRRAAWPDATGCTDKSPGLD